MTKLGTLQALRGLAASLVILSHALQSLELNGAVPKELDLLYWYIGWTGVRVFFVISGFIMMKTVYDEPRNINTAFVFLNKRFIRIIPNYYIATFVTLSLSHFMKREFTFIEIITSVLFIPNIFENNNVIMSPVVGQGWTLNYEMFFYIVFAVSLIFPRRISTIGIFLGFFGLTTIPMSNLLPAGSSPQIKMCVFYTDPIILLFVLGIAIAIVKRKWLVSKSFDYPMTCIFILLISDIASFYIMTFIFNINMPVIASFCFSVSCVVVCAFARNAEYSAYKNISEAFGDASYSTYLYHTFVLALLNRIFIYNSVYYNILYICVCVLCGNILGYAIYLWIERPISSYLRKWDRALGPNREPKFR